MDANVWCIQIKWKWSTLPNREGADTSILITKKCTKGRIWHKNVCVCGHAGGKAVTETLADEEIGADRLECEVEYSNIRILIRYSKKIWNSDYLVSLTIRIIEIFNLIFRQIFPCVEVSRWNFLAKKIIKHHTQWNVGRFGGFCQWEKRVRKYRDTFYFHIIFVQGAPHLALRPITLNFNSNLQKIMDWFEKKNTAWFRFTFETSYVRYLNIFDYDPICFERFIIRYSLLSIRHSVLLIRR